MNASTINSTNLTVGGVTGTVYYSPSTYTATFTPSSPLAASTTYTAAISSAVRDQSANHVAGLSWSFTTGTAADSTSPYVMTVVPANNAANIPCQQRHPGHVQRACECNDDYFRPRSGRRRAGDGDGGCRRQRGYVYSRQPHRFPVQLYGDHKYGRSGPWGQPHDRRLLLELHDCKYPRRCSGKPPEFGESRERDRHG